MPKTIRQVLQSSNLEKTDCEAILQFVLKKPRSYLYTWPEKELNKNQQKHFEQLCHQRSYGEPIAYILGEKEFYSRLFKVNQHTLIPRPETELLVEKALKIINSALTPISSATSVLDMGTGSGIIAITLNKEINIKVDACDISSKALEIAQKNAKQLNADVSFVLSDWYQLIPKKQYDIIISNPPYIEDKDPHLNQGDLRFEPLFALSSGKDGLDDIKTIIKGSKKYLKPKGTLIMEHGYNQKIAVQTLFKKQGFDEIKSFKDYNQQDRITQAKSIK